MNPYLRGALAAALLCAAPVCALRAQGWSTPPTAERCGEWTTGLAAGGDAALNAVTYGNLPACPSTAAAALGGAVRAARSAADSAYLGRLAATAGDVKDPAVFAAALEVAADGSASDGARVMALLVTVALLGSSQEVEGRTRPQLFTDPLPATGLCGFEIASTGPVIDRPLPADAERQAAQVLDGIRSGRREPALLQNLARCARSVISPDIPVQVPVTGIRVDYVCGNRYRVQNHSGAAVTLNVSAEGSSATVDVLAPDIGGWTAFTAPGSGAVTVRYEGRLVATVANGGRRCNN